MAKQSKDPLESCDDPYLMELLDVFREIAPEYRERFVRFAERLAAMSPAQQSLVTPETMLYMLENDVDLPRH